MTNREKCIELWSWLALQSDEFFARHQTAAWAKEAFYDEMSFEEEDCAACTEAQSLKVLHKGESMCNYCPITWAEGGIKNYCMSAYSPYLTFDQCPNQESAIEILEVIKETWKE